MQDSIDSYTKQLIQELNRGTKYHILNTFQGYLKRQPLATDMEIQAARKLGYNLGIKLVRGAYLNEEREIA